MSFSADFAEQDRERLLGGSGYAEDYEPTWTEGSLLGGIGRGIVSGATQLTLQAAQYGNDPNQAILLNVPTDEEELARRAAIGQQRLDFAKSIRPSADANGKASQVMFDLGDSFTRFGIGMLSGGLPVAAATVGASTGEQQYLNLRDQGVDAPTAAQAGAVQGVSGAAMAFMPAARFVKPLLGDAAIAVGANIGIGVASRGSTAALLERAGYTEQAKQFAAFDRTAILTDGILGSAFFGVGRLATRGVVEPTPEQIDAALAENNSRSHIIDTAPGAPVDLPSELNHQRLMDHVADQINRGEEVTIPEWYKGEFLVRDELEPLQLPREAVEVMAAEDAVPAFVAKAGQDAARGAPNIRDLRTEVSQVKQQLELLNSTFRDRAKANQGPRTSRKQAESAARKEIAQEHIQLSQRVMDLEGLIKQNRIAERAKADLAAMRRGETPRALQDAITKRADQMSALRREVAAANREPIERRVDTNIGELMADSGLGGDVEGVITSRPTDTPSNPRPDAESDIPPHPASERQAEPATQPATPEAPLRQPREQLGGDLQLAREAAVRQPETMVNSGFDADGNMQRSRAEDVMAEIEAEHQTGVKDAQSYMAAIKCLLG